ncbi:MAG: hypothetical protein K0S33_4043 [Bacteroidetes bacterium]|jgi:hypothetical protein|nr:hypothetical protein [Bacteroidota bacterium]
MVTNLVILEIFPSFLNSCYLQVEEESGKALFQKNQAPVLNDEGESWSFEVEPAKVSELKELSQRIIAASREDKRLILDGVSLHCTLDLNGVSTHYKFRCPEQGTDELKLVRLWLELVEDKVKDQNCENYLELLKGYFFESTGIKHYDEQPYRIKIYGAHSIYKKEALTKALQSVSKRDELLIDMSNFESMGTALYECFTPLFHVKKLRFAANEAARDHLLEMGFSADLINLVGKSGKNTGDQKKPEGKQRNPSKKWYEFWK